MQAKCESARTDPIYAGGPFTGTARAFTSDTESLWNDDLMLE
jgi:hypothetical protein